MVRSSQYSTLFVKRLNKREDSLITHIQGVDKYTETLSILYILSNIFTNNRWIVLELWGYGKAISVLIFFFSENFDIKVIK